jgi:hypothetical protein
MSTQNKPKRFKRRSEVKVDSENFAKWDVNVPPSCAVITKGGVVIANASPTNWSAITVYTLRKHQVLEDFTQIEINEKIEEMLEKHNNTPSKT